MAGAPRGIDGAPARAVIHAQLAGLISTLDGTEYSGESLTKRVEDPEWLTPRAVTHDALVTWASDRGAVIPFPMWVMFTDEAAVREMLATRAADLGDTLQRVGGARELCVRVSGDQAALAIAAETMDSALVVLEQQAEVAPPGQAYLLRRKLADARKTATREAATRIAEQTHDALTGQSRTSVARATAVSRERGVLLDGAYLVADEEYDAFRAVLTDLMSTYEPAGLRFDFTGPWPPYHFVRDN